MITISAYISITLGKKPMKAWLLFTAVCLGMTQPAFGAQKITCTGILIEVDMTPRADFPMAVVYDNSDELKWRTCVLDLGHAGHWPLRGACWVGERCVLSGPYYKKITIRITCESGTRLKLPIIARCHGRNRWWRILVSKTCGCL